MFRIIVAGAVGVVVGFFGCAILLTAGALADARSQAGAYARLVGQFMRAYQDENLLAIMDVYNAARRMTGEQDKTE